MAAVNNLRPAKTRCPNHSVDQQEFSRPEYAGLIDLRDYAIAQWPHKKFHFEHGYPLPDSRRCDDSFALLTRVGGGGLIAELLAHIGVAAPTDVTVAAPGNALGQ